MHVKRSEFNESILFYKQVVKYINSLHKYLPIIGPNSCIFTCNRSGGLGV